MKDALRDEIYDAVKKASDAGMRIIMITGDHKINATGNGPGGGGFNKIY